MRKLKLGLIAMSIVTVVVLLTAQVAMASVVGGAGTEPQTGGTTSGAGKTGAPVLILGAAGSALAGAGYFLRRRTAK